MQHVVPPRNSDNARKFAALETSRTWVLPVPEERNTMRHGITVHAFLIAASTGRRRKAEAGEEEKERDWGKKRRKGGGERGEGRREAKQGKENCGKEGKGEGVGRRGGGEREEEGWPVASCKERWEG